MAMDEVDIRKMTDLAESGQGCTLRDQLRSIPFEQSIFILKQIEKTNAEDRDTNPALHPLWYSSNGNGNEAHAEIYRTSPGSNSWGDEIFKDSLGIDNTSSTAIGQRSFSCQQSEVKK